MSELILEISGSDFVGKSTQSALMTFETHHMHVETLGSLDGYAADSIPVSLPPQEFFNWWFVDSSYEEIGSALCSAYAERLDHAKTLSELDLVVVERGRQMLQAQLVANYATRTCSAPSNFYDFAADLIDRNIGPKDPKTIEAILIPNQEWQYKISKIKEYVRGSGSEGTVFTSDQNAFYGAYQTNLQISIDELAAHTGATTVDVNGPAVDVNNLLREHPELDDLRLPKLLPHDPLVLGLAGLSESGKGALADELVRNWDFTRLKIGYFNENLRGPNQKFGDPAKIALHAVHFLATNRHVQRMSLESLYGPQLHAEMKTLIGNRWKSAFIALPASVRLERLLDQFPDADPDDLIAEQNRKDQEKLNNGILEYINIADTTVDNSGPIESTVKLLMENIQMTATNNSEGSLDRQMPGILSPLEVIEKLQLSTVDALPVDFRPKRCRAVIYNQNGDSILGIIRDRPERATYAVYPGGGLEESDDTVVDGIVRELSEELDLTPEVDYVFTGHVAPVGDELFFFGYTTTELANLRIHGPEADRDPATSGTYTPSWIPLDALSQSRMFPEEISALIEYTDD